MKNLLLHILTGFLLMTMTAPLALPAPLKKTPCDLFLIDAAKQRNRVKVMLERYLLPLKEIERAFETSPGVLTKNLDEAIEKMASTDVRGKVFRLEALFRMYRKVDRYEAEFSQWRDMIKLFEDKLGGWQDMRSSIKKMEAVGAPKEVITYLKDETAHMYDDLKKFLTDNGWVPGSKNNAYDRMNELLSDIDWPKQKIDQVELRDLLVKQIKDLEETSFDMSDLQGGVHELRRQMRWFLIETHAVRGKITFADKMKMPKEVMPLVTMNQLPGSIYPYDISEGIKHTIEVPKGYYVAFSNITAHFGALKDSGEYWERLAHAFMNSSLKMKKSAAESEAKKLLTKAGLYKDFQAESEHLYKMIQETQILKNFRKVLEEIPN